MLRLAVNQELPYDLTIVTVCRNALHFLPRCIASVQPLYDTPLKVEHLIIDGASTDGSVAYLWCQQHAGHITRFISEADDGIYHAMNKGINLSRGRVLVFINADDEICPGAVQACCLPVLNGAAQYSVASTLCIGKKKQLRHPRLENTLWRQPYCHQAMYCSRELLVKMGGFDAVSFPIGADTDLMRRLYIQHIPCAVVPVVAARFYEGGVSSTAATHHDVYELMLKFADGCRREIQHHPSLVGPIVKHLRRYANKKIMQSDFPALRWKDSSRMMRFMKSVSAPLNNWQRFILQCWLRAQICWYAVLSYCSFGRKRRSSRLNLEICSLFANCI